MRPSFPNGGGSRLPRAKLAPALIGCALQAWAASPLMAAPAQGEGDTVYVVQPGDTLSGIAAALLDDAGAWRRLQAVNDIADPRVLRPGTGLRIPSAAKRPDAAPAEAVLVKGEVRVRRAPGSPAELVESGAQLAAGSTIETGDTGLLTLRFADGSRLLVSPNSRLTLAQLMLNRKTGEAVTRATLEAGDVESSVVPLRGINARYEVKTPSLNLAVRGTAFRVQVDEAQGLTRGMVTEGGVKTGNAQGDALLPAGYGTLAERGGAPLAPRALLPPPVLRGDAPVITFFPARFSWEAVADATQYRVELLEGSPAERLAQSGRVEAAAADLAHLPNGEYRLRVRGVDALGLEGMNGLFAFKVQAWPAPPLVAEPRDEGASAERVRFRWAHVTDADFLRFQLARSPDFAEMAVQVRKLSRLSTGFSLALTPGRYYWRLAAGTDNGGLGPYGPVQSFEVIAAGAEGAAAASLTPRVLRWPVAAAGERYQVQVAKEAGFAAPSVDLRTEHAELALPDAAEPVFVRIKRIAADGLAAEFESAQYFEPARE